MNEYPERENHHLVRNLSIEEMVPPVEPAFDPWQLQEGKGDYRRDRFYVKSVKSKRQGGSPKNVQVPFDPDDYLIMSQIIQQRIIPAYGTIQDLIRDAVTHRLHDLTHGDPQSGLQIHLTDPEIVRLAQMQQVTAKIDMMGRHTRWETEQAAKAVENLKAAAAAGDRQVVAGLIAETEELLEVARGHNTRNNLKEVIANYRNWLKAAQQGGHQAIPMATPISYGG